MITCKICGKSVKHDLVTHIRNSHKITKVEYIEKYGETVFYSEELLKKRSETCKNNWNKDEYRQKQKEKAKIKYTEEVREKMSYNSKKYFENNNTWNMGLTKETDERVKKIGENNKNILKGRKKENYEYLQKHSDFMKKNSIFVTNNPSYNKTEEWNLKISKTLSKKISNGEINTMSNFKNGEYESITGERFYYASSLELEAMVLFDKYNLEWTNKHGIIIPYEDVENIKRNYIPDFLVKNKYVIETEGWYTEEVTIKEKYSKEIYGEKYQIFYDSSEVERFIKNEIIKN